MFIRKIAAPPGKSRPLTGGQEAILFGVWLLVNSFILLYRGIYLEGESAKYIDQAHLLLQTGRVESPNFWLYIIPISLIAVCIRTGLNFAWVVLIQLLVNLFATGFFYRTAARLFANERLAFVGTLLLLLNYFYQEFNSFLYTESLFYSLTLILSCYLMHIEQLTIKRSLGAVLLLILVSFTRPSGLLFLPPVFLYLFLVFFKDIATAKKIALLAGIGVAFLFLLNLALGSGGQLDFMLPFRDERIICGVPTLPAFLPIRTTANGNSVYGLLYYILHNPVQFIRMASLRTVAFFGLYRSYYSAAHNAWLIGYFYCIHMAALIAIPWWIRHRRGAFWYFLSAIGLTWLTVMLTCDDWHNRFYLTVSPFLILLALPVLQRSFKAPAHDK